MRVYARILRTPGVALIVLATLIGRLPIGISGLAILLYVEEVSDSFAAAGLCAGALALGSAAGAPFQGRLIDRRGVAMLLPLAIAHAAGLLTIWVAGEAGAPVALLAAASLVAGTAIPPVSSVLRSRWPYLLRGRPELMAGAFALDSVMIELIFVTGPLITTVVVATVGPQYALIVSAACVLFGTSLLLTGLAGRPGPERTETGRPVIGAGRAGLARPANARACQPAGRLHLRHAGGGAARLQRGRRVEGAGRSAAGDLVRGERSRRAGLGGARRRTRRSCGRT